MLTTKQKRLEIKSIPLDKLPADTQELTIAILGSVDSSKTSLLGVIANPLLRENPHDNLLACLDDGNGKARAAIIQFPHERATGRTSSISYTPILFDRTYWPALCTNRVIMATDLCGHEQYLKTTIAGICGSRCNFAIVCIDKINDNINPMTREHIKLLLALNISFAIIFSKIDLQTEPELKRMIREVTRLLKFKKKIFLIKKESDLDIILDYDIFVPIFLVSCKTGYGILNLLNFMTRIPYTPPNYPPVFAIDSTFLVLGHGIVVSGCSGISISVNDKLMLGPFNAKTQFVEITVRSIHDNYRNFIGELAAGRRGCICLRFAPKDSHFRNKIKSGMILTRPSSMQVALPPICSQFRAEVSIFAGHYTTIKTGFNAICNIGTIRAPAIFTLISKKESDVARSGDTLIVDLKFPMQICPPHGAEFIFREGIGIGHGKILFALN